VTITIKGAKVKLSPTSLVFPRTIVGKTASVKTVTLTNNGNATLNISTIAITGDFFQKVVTGSCVSGSTVLAGKSCTIKVNFKPTQVGLRTGTVSITDNAAGSPQTVALSGTGK
jgi:archaellum component FlaF (FlaF/FlaG flagellin family)